MARKEWTEEQVKELERRIRDKVQAGIKLSCGEDTLWGAIKADKPLTPRLVSDVDDMMSIDF